MEERRIFLGRKLLWIGIVLCLICVAVFLWRSRKEELDWDREAYEEQHSLYIEGYRETIDGIRERAEAASGIRIFNQKDSFSILNREKTVEDYEKIRNVRVTVGHGIDRAVDRVWTYREFSWICVLFLFLMLFALTEEQRNETELLLFSTFLGRSVRMGRKARALAIGCAVFCIGTGGLLLICSVLLHGGLEDLLLPLASVERFRDLTENWTVGGYLLFSLLQRSFFLWSGGILFLCIFQALPGKRLAALVSGCILIVEYLLFRFLPPQSLYNLLKYGNLFALFLPEETDGIYRNLVFCGRLIRLQPWIRSVSVALAAVFLFFLLLLGRKRPQKGTVFSWWKRRMDGFLEVVRGWFGWCSMAILEWWKLLFTERSIWVYLVLGIALHLIRPVNHVFYSPVSEFQHAFYEKFTGPVSEEAIQYLEEEEKKIQQVMEDYRIAQQAVKEGKGDVRDAEQKRFLNEASQPEREALEKLQQQIAWMKEVEEKSGIQPWLMKTDGFRYLFGERGQQDRNKRYMLLWMAAVLLAIGDYAQEKKLGLTSVLKSCELGREVFYRRKGRLFVRKLAVAFLLTEIVYARWIRDIYGFSYWEAPLQSLEEFSAFPLPVSICMYAAFSGLLAFAFFALVLGGTRALCLRMSVGRELLIMVLLYLVPAFMEAGKLLPLDRVSVVSLLDLRWVFAGSIQSIKEASHFLREAERQRKILSTVAFLFWTGTGIAGYTLGKRFWCTPSDTS